MCFQSSIIAEDSQGRERFPVFISWHDLAPALRRRMAALCSADVCDGRGVCFSMERYRRDMGSSFQQSIDDGWALSLSILLISGPAACTAMTRQ